MPLLTDRQEVHESADILEELATDIRSRLRGLLWELRIVVEDGGAVLHGRATSFYGKQLALHEARRANVAVVANRIVVS